MVGRRRKSRKRGVLGNHQRAWLWGRHAVVETLRAGRWVPLEVRIATDILDEALIHEVERLCQQQSIECSHLTSDALQQLVHARDHQGIAARMPSYPWQTLEQFFEGIHQQGLIVVLDRIQDPHNLGSILRSADLFGVQGIVVGTQQQCDVTSHVVRSSVGAVNYLHMCRTESLPQAVAELKAQQFQIVGATENGMSLPETALSAESTAVIIGNEGQGIDEQLLTACDIYCAIPQTGHVGSLNAAVAAGILFYEAFRQQCKRSSG